MRKRIFLAKWPVPSRIAFVILLTSIASAHCVWAGGALKPDPDRNGWGKFPSYIRALSTYQTNQTPDGTGGVEFGYLERGTYENPSNEVFVVNSRPDIDVDVTLTTYAGERLQGSCPGMTFQSLGIVRSRLGSASLPTTIVVRKSSRKNTPRSKSDDDEDDSPDADSDDDDDDRSQRVPASEKREASPRTPGAIAITKAMYRTARGASYAEIDCTTFVVKTLQNAGFSLDKATLRRIYMADVREDEIMDLVDKGDVRITGVAGALIKSGQAVSVKSTLDVQPGDVVQYWEKNAPVGHAAIIEKRNRDGTVVLYGSHKSRGGVGRITVKLGRYEAWVARPK